MKLTGVLAVVAASLLLACSANGTERSTTVGAAELVGSTSYPDASGRATIYLFPRHAEVDLAGLKNLPRRPNSIFLVWLATSETRGFVGGAFPRNAVPHGLSTIVPGGKPVSRANARAAERTVLTVVDRDRALDRLRREERKGWSRRIGLLGKPVAVGTVER